jgi:predicted DNA binding CopG/RHH family protein
MKLDKEEKDILEALERDEIKTLTPSKKEIAEIKAMAENTLRKDRRVTIRLYDHDLKGIQKKAIEKGMPYQTLISSMIHQYIEGDLVERKIG